MKKTCLYLLLLIVPILAASCSDSNGGDEPAVELKFLSSTPANGATDVSTDITEIQLTFNQTIKVQPMGYKYITLNGSNISDDITYSGSQVTIALHNVSQSTTYELVVPTKSIVDASGNTIADFTVKFTTAKSTINITPDLSPDKTGMDLDAIPLTYKIYAGWDLGNSFESCGGTWNDNTQTWEDVWMQDRNEWETAWGNPKTTNEMIVALKNAGFNAVRIPVRWYPHVTNDETMEIDSRWIARVKEVVDYCVNNGLYVIINTHHDLWMENHPFYAEAEAISKKETALWRNIATYFRDYDEHLLFACSNEVNVNWAAPTEENYNVQNGFNQDFVKAVRSTGGKNWYRNLVLQTYSANPSYGLAGFVAPADVVEKRLSVEYHYYDPYDYCGSCTVYYWGKDYAQYGISSYSQEADMSALFSQMAQKWHAQGLGVIMGETGVAYHTKGTTAEVARQVESQKYYLQTVYSTAKANGIAPFVWDNNAFGNGSENFGIFSRGNGMKVIRTEWLEGIMQGAKTSYPAL
jgi:endoglucanase